MIQARSEKGKAYMDESEFRPLAKWQISVPPHCSENRIQYLLKTEDADSSVDFCSSANIENSERYL